MNPISSCSLCFSIKLSEGISTICDAVASIVKKALSVAAFPFLYSWNRLSLSGRATKEIPNEASSSKTEKIAQEVFTPAALWKGSETKPENAAESAKNELADLNGMVKSLAEKKSAGPTAFESSRKPNKPSEAENPTEYESFLLHSWPDEFLKTESFSYAKWKNPNKGFLARISDFFASFFSKAPTEKIGSFIISEKKLHTIITDMNRSHFAFGNLLIPKRNDNSLPKKELDEAYTKENSVLPRVASQLEGMFAPSWKSKYLLKKIGEEFLHQGATVQTETFLRAAFYREYVEDDKQTFMNLVGSGDKRGYTLSFQKEKGAQDEPLYKVYIFNPRRIVKKVLNEGLEERVLAHLNVLTEIDLTDLLNPKTKSDTITFTHFVKKVDPTAVDSPSQEE